MLNFNDFLYNQEAINEGVYDKNIFKAFFLAGGPGSGKSWVSARTLMGQGMKVINSDDGFENYAKKVGLELKMTNMSAFQTKQKNFLRTRAKRGTMSMHQHAIDGRLGMIMDSTARDTARIEAEAQSMRYLGYDTYMVFVNTTLEVALKRNEMRPRSVPEPIVINSHRQIQKNIPKLRAIFGSKNFVEVDNSVEAEDVNIKVYKEIQKLVRSKPSSPMAQAWINNELAKKRR
jgi:predicted kinase